MEIRSCCKSLIQNEQKVNCEEFHRENVKTKFGLSIDLEFPLTYQWCSRDANKWIIPSRDANKWVIPRNI